MHDFERQQKAVAAALKSAIKGSDSKALKKAAGKEERVFKKDVMSDVLRSLLNETIDLIVTGEFTYEEGIDDFASAAKSVDIDSIKSAKKSESDGTDSG